MEGCSYRNGEGRCCGYSQCKGRGGYESTSLVEGRKCDWSTVLVNERYMLGLQLIQRGRRCWTTAPIKDRGDGGAMTPAKGRTDAGATAHPRDS